MSNTFTTPSRGRWWGAMALASLLVMTAACGNSNDTKATPTTLAAATTATPTTPAAAAATTATPTTPAGILEARSIVRPYLEQPTKIGISEPINAKIPTGKKVVLISCGVQACDDLGLSMAEAAKVLGWEFELYRTNGSPEDIQRAFDRAVQAKPFGVTYQAIPAELISRQLEQLKAAGTYVFPCCVFSGDKYYSGNIIDFAAHERYGKLNAAALVAAGGPGAGFGMVCVNTITSLEILCKNFKNEVERLCPDCTVDRLDLTIPQLGAGEAPQRVVDFLRANPRVKRLWFTNDDFTTGLFPALKSAGISDVRVHGFATNTQTIALVRSGVMESSFPAPQVETAWYFMDGFARLAAGQPIDPTVAAGKATSWSIPNQLWTANRSTFDPSLSGSNLPSDLPTSDGLLPIAPLDTIRQGFTALWGK